MRLEDEKGCSSTQKQESQQQGIGGVWGGSQKKGARCGLGGNEEKRRELEGDGRQATGDDGLDGRAQIRCRTVPLRIPWHLPQVAFLILGGGEGIT